MVKSCSIVVKSVKFFENVRLIDGSETWGKWKEAPIPIYLNFYIHHITNPDEVEHGLKPKFEEKGPYAYRQKRVKVDIKQEDGLNTVKYKEVKTYFFDKKISGRNSEDDLVNVPNIPFVGVVHTVQKMFPIDFVVGLVGNVVIPQETLILRNVRVGELLFTGFDVTKYTQSLLNRRLPKEFKGGRFGLYKGKNGTESPEWQVYTGYENSADFGRVKSWDGKPDLLFWRKFSECDKVKGTDGSVFSPFLTKNSVIEVFSPDICRSISLVFETEIEYMGVPGYRFTTPSWVFADPREREENRCFCLEENLEDCPHAGVLPLESCMNAPIWSSSPYFLGADVRYITEAGLKPPEREKHKTFIDIEPTTGLVLRAHKRIQVSLEIRPHPKVTALQHLQGDKMLFPLIWADENAKLDEFLVNDLKSKLITPLQIVGIAKWALLILGIILFIVGAGVFTVKYLLATDFSGISDKLKEIRSSSITSLK
ncbi:Lysosome membrane protein 2 [Orchesella cincta]|uniref:Lysosome membrane protein 2 n=1 Tax=Orchesella cincta TaxID=48709 RepID=A0A1D2MIJ9_ORCCI|nr:Lysosome membrane protein 2 [Orchesella cincta]